MRTASLACCAAALIAVGLLAPPSALAQRRSAETILADYERVEFPKYDRESRSDPEYRAAYDEEYSAAVAAQCELALQLYAADPNHEKNAELLPRRWASLANIVAKDAEKLAELLDELEGFIANDPKGELATSALYAKAQTYMRAAGSKNAERKDIVAAVNAFVEHSPKDDRAPRLLMTVAQRHTPADEQAAAYRSVLKAYPDSRATRYTKGKIRQIEGHGKPFQLEFNEATTGERVSLRRLKGQVIVVDFWATWCGPCVAEMPQMKELYAKYRDQGVEFIGVSLDQTEEKGGLTKLKAYCADNQIEWPQYYQGNYWSSEFSKSWGINGIPTMFVVDADGNLHSTTARGKLDKMLPTLLGLEVPQEKSDG